MSGDILKAYDQSGLFTLSSVSEDYMVEPVYSEEVLNQIHNATVLRDFWVDPNTENWTIEQNVDDQIIYFSPALTLNPNSSVSKSIVPTLQGAVLNMPWDNVTPENTMVGSRLTVTVKRTGSGNSTVFRPDAFASEIVLMALYSFNNYATPNDSSVELESYSIGSIAWNYGGGNYTIPSMMTQDTYTTAEMLTLINLISEADYQSLNRLVTIQAIQSQFDWAPIIYTLPINLSYKAGSVGTVISTNIAQRNISAINGDMANWALVTSETLKNMHLTAIMSEFDIPEGNSF